MYLYPLLCGRIKNTNESVNVVTGYVQLDAAMRNSSRYEGETLRIRCEITGFPLPRYVWLKDGRAVDELPASTSRRFSAKTTPWGSRCAIIIAHLPEMIHCPAPTRKKRPLSAVFEIICLVNRRFYVTFFVLIGLSLRIIRILLFILLCGVVNVYFTVTGIAQQCKHYSKGRKEKQNLSKI